MNRERQQMKTDNEFGDQTYWNRPVQGRQQRKLVSRYATLCLKPTANSKFKAAKAKSPSRSPSPKTTSGHPKRSPSPTPSHISSVSTIVPPVHSAQKSTEEENDDKDEKSIVKIMKSIRESEDQSVCLSGHGYVWQGLLTHTLRVYRSSQAPRVLGQGRTRHGRVISTMAQLKNCCLGGLKAGPESEGNSDLVADFNPLFPLLFI